MKRVILHTSDSAYGNGAIITRWHLSRGFKDIGYHFVILNGRPTHDYTDKKFDGYVETGRSIHQYGSHCKGHNDAIGICIVGRPGHHTDKQIESCRELIQYLEEFFDDQIFVYQHSEFDYNKSYCASIDMSLFKEWRDDG